MNGYICFYKGKRIEVYAETTAQAQRKAAEQLRAKKHWEVSVCLAEKNGEQVIHQPQEYCP